jgi:hypothetical protein
MRVAALCATSDENVSRERPAHTANAANPSPPNGEETQLNGVRVAQLVWRHASPDSRP